MLLFRAHHLSLADTLAVAMNGRPVPSRGLRRRDDEVRIDLRPREVAPGPDAAVSRADARPFVTCWFPSPPTWPCAARTAWSCACYAATRPPRKTPWSKR